MLLWTIQWLATTRLLKQTNETNRNQTTEALAGMKTTEEILERSEELKASALVFKRVRSGEGDREGVEFTLCVCAHVCVCLAVEFVHICVCMCKCASVCLPVC